MQNIKPNDATNEYQKGLSLQTVILSSKAKTAAIKNKYIRSLVSIYFNIHITIIKLLARICKINVEQLSNVKRLELGASFLEGTSFGVFVFTEVVFFLGLRS